MTRRAKLLTTWLLTLMTAAQGMLGCGHQTPTPETENPPQGASPERLVEHGWPLDDMGNIHPVGNSSREFQLWNSKPPFYHGGIDILMDPELDSLRAVVKSRAVAIYEGESSIHHSIEIRPSQGTGKYLYVHVGWSTIPQSIIDAQQVGYPIGEGAFLGQAVDWPHCGYNHVHFARYLCGGTNGECTDQLDPLLSIRPVGDAVPPTIAGVYLTENETDFYFSGAPQRIKGDVDIIVEMYDRINSSKHKTGVENAAVRVQRQEASGWSTVWEQDSLFPAEGVPPRESAASIFKTSGPRASDSSYCSGEKFFYILTNKPADKAVDRDGVWDTDGGVFPNGRYRLDIRAWDVAGNSAQHFLLVDVVN